jgi:hypothetical protein
MKGTATPYVNLIFPPPETLPTRASDRQAQAVGAVGCASLGLPGGKEHEACHAVTDGAPAAR